MCLSYPALPMDVVSSGIPQQEPYSSETDQTSCSRVRIVNASLELYVPTLLVYVVQEVLIVMVV